MSKSVAQGIAALFNDDGTCTSSAGTTLDEQVAAEKGRIVHYYGRETVYRFVDGSHIAVIGNVWDIVTPYQGGFASVAADGSINPNGWLIGVQK